MSKPLVIKVVDGSKELFTQEIPVTEIESSLTQFSKPRKLKRYLKEVVNPAPPKSPLVNLKGTFKVMSYKDKYLVEVCRVNLASEDHSSIITESTINKIVVEAV